LDFLLVLFFFEELESDPGGLTLRVCAVHIFAGKERGLEGVLQLEKRRTGTCA
jgi:hypothetical protein